jgi:hypothetical protein
LREGFNGAHESLLISARERFKVLLRGRFTILAPAKSSAKLPNPQSWNRYSYALGNPLKFIDPNGKEAVLFYRPPDRNQSSLKDFGHVFLFYFYEKQL